MNSRAEMTIRRNPASSAPAPATSIGATREPDPVMSPDALFTAPERRREMIAEAAYYRAERRGFEPGHELEDWCGAELEIDDLLARTEVPAAPRQ